MKKRCIQQICLDKDAPNDIKVDKDAPKVHVYNVELCHFNSTCLHCVCCL